MSSADTIRFKGYRGDFEALKASFTQKIASTIPATDPRSDQRKLLTNQVLRELEEADELVAQMEAEIAPLPRSQQTALASHVRSCKEDVRRARKELEKATVANERLLLLSSPAGRGRDGDLEAATQDQRTRLLFGTERLQNSSRRLEDMQRLALETETVGVGTLNELNNQREQIVRTRETLNRADSWVTRSQNVLMGMQRELTRQNVMTALFILFLIAMIVLVVYFKWFRTY
ncbi:hypothetical protein DFJ73DRAFT_869714 [Zopfochytrium polystomum]|nr:hypothetical protein DFJ73DRAFT_869714 [Zopfochytrium polystomum]